MNPLRIRPLLRSTRHVRPIRRTLVTPTAPVHAQVKEVEQELDTVIAGETEDGHGEWSFWTMLITVELFGFKLNPVATATGGNAKSEGRPIYLDMQVCLPLWSC